MIKKALISVWDKDGLIELANFLIKGNLQILCGSEVFLDLGLKKIDAPISGLYFFHNFDAFD